MNGRQLALAARRPLLVPLVLLGAALLVMLGPLDGEAREDASGFARGVQLLVDDGWFKTVDGSDERKIMLAPDVSDGSVSELRTKQSLAVHRLHDYMTELEHWQFDDSGRVTGFTLNDNVPGPFANRNTWSGRMRYGRVPTIDVVPLVRLGNSRGRIALTADPALGLGRGTNWPRLDVGRPAGEEAAGAVFELMCGTQPGAMLYRIADAVVVNARERGRCAVQIGEQRLGDAHYCKNHGISPARCAFGVLRAGDVLAFALPGKNGDRVIARYQRRARPSAAMVMRRDAAGEKIPAPGLGSFVEAVARDLGDAMRGCSNGAGSTLDLDCGEDLRLALDFAVQQDVQRWLNADRENYAARKVPSTAAITVMNALSGEVLGMGGYQAPGSNSCPMPALCLLPVGSVAKPIFAAAAIGGFESGDLSTLEVQHRGAQLNDILGLRFLRSVNNENDATAIGSPVDLQRFIQSSDNHYIESLILLASPEPKGGECAMAAGDWYKIDGKTVTGRRPRSSFEDQRCMPLRSGYQLPFKPPWADKLDEYFALTPYGRSSQDPETLCTGRLFGNMTYDSSVWAKLFLPAVNRCAMIRSGMQRNWMRIEDVRNYRTEAIPLVLGNNGGHWSVIKLAESYSRLATGRAVRASFRYLGGRPETRGIDFRNRNIDVRLPVSRGMARVLEGTAASSDLPGAIAELGATLAAKGHRLGVFAKTGTMQLAGTMAKGCRREVALDACVGKAFAVTLAVYSDQPQLAFDSTIRRVMDAAARPRCAITLVIDLPRWNGKPVRGNPAANVAASLVRGTVGARLQETDGVFCGPRS